MDKILTCGSNLSKVFYNLTLNESEHDILSKLPFLTRALIFKNAYRQAFDERIKDYRNFVRDAPELRKLDDFSGHGTHISGIILNLTCHSEIYIGKVPKEKEIGDQEADPEAIAELCKFYFK